MRDDQQEDSPRPSEDVEYVCPHCGGEVTYIGVTPVSLECHTRGCPNFKKPQ